MPTVRFKPSDHLSSQEMERMKTLQRNFKTLKNTNGPRFREFTQYKREYDTLIARAYERKKQKEENKEKTTV